MLIDVMRAWLRTQEDDATDGWLLALRDPVVARAMNAIHQRPHEPWTMESLAREVSVSRATLARRFAIWSARRRPSTDAPAHDVAARSCATPR